MSSVMMDLRYAFRTLRKSPSFVAVAVLSLALGIALNTTIFSLVKAVLVGSTPYPQPERLAVVSEVLQGAGSDRGRSPAIANVVDWADSGSAFEDIGIAEEFIDSRTFIVDGPAESVYGQSISSNLAGLLGVQPVIGRAFAPRDESILLSYPFWESRFAGRPEIVGKTVLYGGRSVTVAGVMPPGFVVLGGNQVDVWSNQDMRDPRSLTRKDHWFTAIGRLKPGVTTEEAQRRLAVISAELAKAYPETNRDVGVRVDDLRDYVVGDARQNSYILLGAVAFVLLIASANVANLLLARLGARRAEMSLRASLGASRARLARQVMTESLLLAAAGGALGLLLTSWGLEAMKLLVPRLVEGLYVTGADRAVFLFTVAVTACTAFLFGLAPAWQVCQWKLSPHLNLTGRTTSGRSAHRLRSAMVVLEVALSIVLLVGAGLLIRSLLRVHSVNPGFDPGHVVTFQTQLAGEKYVKSLDSELRKIDPAADLFYSRLLERVSALPGVKAAAFTSDLPDTGVQRRTFTIAGRPVPPENDRLNTAYYEVTPSFFATMRIPVLAGRVFDDTDRFGTPWTVVVDEAFAKTHFPDQNPIGQVIRFRFEPYKVEEDQPRTIIGVVGQVKFARRYDQTRPVAYASDLQQPQVFPGGRTSAHLRRRLLLRSQSDPREAMAPLLSAVRTIVSELDPQIPVMTVKSMDFILAETETFSIYLTRLMVVFGILAGLLAAAGIYAVMSYFVTERTRDIGIRMALGAQRGGVLGFVVRKAVSLTLTGAVLGIAAAAGLSRLIRSWLFTVDSVDPLTYALVLLLVGAVALAASYLPARRAAALDPMMAIRHE